MFGVKFSETHNFLRTDTRSFDRQLRSSDERDTPTKKRPKN